MTKKILYQVGRLDDFAAGFFAGILPAGELFQHGNLGIGTFEGGDGELLLMDGKIYQAREDCSIVEASMEAPIPLANVVRFSPQSEVFLPDRYNLEEFEIRLEGIFKELPATGDFRILQARGHFVDMLVRSEKGQQPPYESLKDFLSHAQRERHFHQVNGVLVGLYFPEKYGDLNAAGWHFHFISDDKLYGGHVLSFCCEKITVWTDVKEELLLEHDKTRH